MRGICKSYSISIFALLALASGCSQKASTPSKAHIAPAPSGGGGQESKIVAKHIASTNESLIKENKLYRYPTLTALLAVKDARRTIEVLKAAGAAVVYDPNLGNGSQIPFLIASIPPQKLSDQDFIEKLELKALSISEAGGLSRIEQKSETPRRAFGDNVYVPLNDIRIPHLQKDHNEGRPLGRNVTVAIIDSGIDAGHPVFQDRVVYWSDQTEETQVALEKLEVKEGGVSFQSKTVKLPAALTSAKEVYAGLISEEKLGVQASFEEKAQEKNPGLDLNQNTLLDDVYLTVVAFDEAKGTYVAYVDVDGNGSISGRVEETAIVDFNEKRASLGDALSGSPEFLVFPARHQTISYPLLVLKDADAKPTALRLGFASGSHGTHVAGIVAGNGLNVVGAAPEAKLMSIKVCSGITCTTDSILRGLVETFYNPQGVVPDVVNISLGSQQQYNQDVIDYLMRDLAAKFGAVFVVSASNSGPGYRSLNSIASFGPTIQVGAHVSTPTLEKQYTLDPAVAKDMPFHHLLFFSSVGPSYTGHLRPNIIAPGSALSSTMLIDTGLEMYNGTSMSSPIVAGSVAALLSIAKEDPVLWDAFTRKAEKIASIKDGSANLEYSLSGLAMAVRSSLENTAVRLDQYTMAQQGHGLVQLDKAYPKLVELMGAWATEQHRYFEVKLNGNAKDTRLYDRSANIAEVKTVDVSIEEDPEMGEQERLLIESSPIQVVLEKVEIQKADGSVEIKSDGWLPFSVGTPGLDGEEARESTLVLSSRRKSFASVRKLDRMEAGSTYLAHYALKQNGIRVQSVLDVVHMPHHFSDAEQKIVTASLSPNGRRMALAQGFANVAIKTNNFHRYPIAVGENDSSLTVELGIPPNVAGSLYLQVYDPDGHEIDDVVIATRANELPRSTPTITRVIDTKAKKGVYEVLVSASNWRWMGNTHYDLILSKERVKANFENIVLKTGESKVLSLVFFNSKLNAKAAQVSSGALEVLQEVKVDVLPGFWSYFPLEVPAGSEALSLSVGDDKNLTFFGRIVNRLYDDVQSENPTVVSTADALESSPGAVHFGDLSKVGAKTHLALETFSVIPENGSLKGASLKVPVEAVFAGTNVGELKTEILPEQSSSNLLVKVSAPESLDASAAITSLEVKVQDKNFSFPVRIRGK
jgi:subtilisin family serine protease